MSKSTPEIERLRDRILKERDAGNIVFWGLPGKLMTVPLDDFIQQPAEGILYDLNRLEEICLTFLDDPKWVNDFAVALTIRKLIAERHAGFNSANIVEAAIALCSCASAPQHKRDFNRMPTYIKEFHHKLFAAIAKAEGKS